MAAAPTLKRHRLPTTEAHTQQPRTICLAAVHPGHICLAPPDLPDFWAEFSWGNAAAMNLPQAHLTRQEMQADSAGGEYGWASRDSTRRPLL